MKLRLLAALAAIMLTTNTYAQKLYIKPYAGAGISNIAGDAGNNSYLTNISRNNDNKLKGLYSISAGLEMGYQLNKLRVSTGIGYLQTGNQNNDVLLIFEGNPPVRDSGSVSIKFKHLLVPVNVGYEINISKKFSITPQTGFAISYNIQRVDDWNTTLNTQKTTVKHNTFTSLYKPISIFSNSSVSFEYSLVKDLKLFVAPTFYYMLTNMDATPANAVYKTTEHPYALHLSIGGMVRL